MNLNVMTGLLTSNGRTSSMRFSLVLISIGIFILLLATATYIIISAIRPEMEQPKWESIGVFIAGVALPVAGIGYSKVQQKKFESNGTNNNLQDT